MSLLTMLEATTGNQKRFTILEVNALLKQVRQAERARVRRLVKKLKQAPRGEKSTRECEWYCLGLDDLLTALKGKP